MTPPDPSAHGFTYTGIDLAKTYTPPSVGGGATTTWGYDLDGLLTQTTRPDGLVVGRSYDAAGRLDAITLPAGQGAVTHAYDPQTGKLASVSGPQGISLAYGRDGELLTSRTWSGAGYPTVSVQQGYDNFFRVATESVNGGSQVSFGYDDDGLLTQAGSLSVSRDPQNGRVTGSSVGSVSDAFGYNAYGELASYSAQVGGSALVAVSYVRDDLGRIVEKSETVQGQASTRYYAYDLAGRLTDVLGPNNALVAHYAYDANGNRLARTTPQGTESGSYDAQDRVVSYGSKTYGFTDAGEFAEVTDAATGAVTSYAYDALGNLRQVILPSGSLVEYVVDGENHRVWKKKDGVVVQGFVYRESLQPVAELDAGGNVVAQFVYAEGVNVPEVMVKGGATYRLVKDHLGSVRLVVDVATGAVAQRVDYDEFGRVLVDTAPGFQPFGFAGGLYDADTGLVRFGARDYDAATGRWTAKDPLRFGGGNANLFAYVAGDGINGSDPLGLMVQRCYGGLQTFGGWPRAHEWLRTSQICAGLTGVLWDTMILPHDDDSMAEAYPGYSCEPMEMVDEDCVIRALQRDLGTHRGWFTPSNNCQTYAEGILDECFSWNVCTDSDGRTG